ncbi:PH domain-containing protein [Ponticaulis sp.]|uniref:PH domain-containing protein n=1 Tax=Ponticaulis sp. TaxID=2020902 RepID=UPI000B635559|nr:PH domain-containing protein [Ponticaulis sp.]MAI90658.1 hypothetical protein [Ponticaulis sp.]OUX99168.1 MAG: hypothetical protein CBB65_09480 [Hyphomonadaceae bacterium TMED5]|tara:strand:+ start:47024 stop:47485 length:462 start_codon:yes stop_codon:yes gene_type:complete
MKYISKRLFDGEAIEYCGDFHGLHKFMAWMTLLFLGVFLIGIYLFIKMKVRFATTEFCVTSRRIVLKTGLFTAHMIDLELDAIEGAHIYQSFFGRIFGYGDVIVQGRGEGGIDFPIMAHPGRFVAAIEEARMHAQAAPMEMLSEELHHAQAAE